MYYNLSLSLILNSIYCFDKNCAHTLGFTSNVHYQLQAEAQMIYDEFLSESAPTPVNIDFHTIHQVAASLNCPHKDMFAKAQREVRWHTLSVLSLDLCD